MLSKMPWIGQIAVRVVTLDGRLQIIVSDTGVGLPPERDRIAEPYMTTRQTGTGLGLAIVKKIVDDHLGEIEFQDASGGGARVTITLFFDRLQNLVGQSGDVIEAAAETVPGRTRISKIRESDGA
jgi:two-component system, NtrC family, nitrogen regulation sensor histidine kinase NtrY